MSTKAQLIAMLQNMDAEYEEADIVIMIGSNQSTVDQVFVDSNGKVIVADQQGYDGYHGV